MDKVIIFSAPSGAGKSTIVNHILSLHPELEFSISATSRAPRGTEKDGVEYYFFTADQFRQMIAEDKFIEHEEVRKMILHRLPHADDCRGQVHRA